MADERDPTLTLATRGELFDAHRALVDRLQLAFPERQFVHQVVPARISKGVWAAMTKRLPCICTGFAGLTPDRSNGQIYRAEARWMVFLVVTNPFPKALLLGDSTGAPGQLGVVGLAVAMLNGWTVPGLGTWTVGAVQNVSSEEDWFRDDVGLVTLECSIQLEIVDSEAAAALPEFLRFGAQWALPDIDGGIDTLDTVRSAA